jgi:hypothetical protein
MDTSGLFHSFIGRRLLSLGLGTVLVAAAAAARGADYDALVIVSPESEATIHDNAGNIDVEAEVTPPLRVAAGDRLVLIVDGAPMPPSRRNHLTLTAVDRGSHTLQAQVVDPSGRTLISSQPLTVYMWQASALFPGRAGR